MPAQHPATFIACVICDRVLKDILEACGPTRPPPRDPPRNPPRVPHRAPTPPRRPPAGTCPRLMFWAWQPTV